LLKNLRYCIVFLDGFIRNKKAIINPVTSPVSTERKITIARDASNFQKKKVIATGIAF
jgi:hypothetical protein